MTSKIEVSREMAERIVKDGAISVAQIDQLRQKLAATEAPRQEPVYEKPNSANYYGHSNTYIDWKYSKDTMALVEHLESIIDAVPDGPLYTAPLSPDHSGGASQDVIKFGIEVEKLLCATLGREWSATGISIQSLIEELKSLTTSDHSGGGDWMVAINAAEAFGKGFNLLEQESGKYRITMAFQNSDDAFAAYRQLAELRKFLDKVKELNQ